MPDVPPQIHLVVGSDFLALPQNLTPMAVGRRVTATCAVPLLGSESTDIPDDESL